MIMRSLSYVIGSLQGIFFLSICVIGNVEADQRDSSNSFKNEMLQSSPNNRSYSRQTSGQQRTVIQNQRIRQALARRGGFMARLGDIALGGFLGVVVFGGAFENLKLVDFGVFALIAFIVYQSNVRRILQRLKDKKAKD